MLTSPKKASALRQQSASKLTHFDSQGQAHMVDVGTKSATRRVAIAQGIIFMQPETLQLILSGQAHKGDVLGVARLAAIMGAKKTADLIPLCHPIALTHIAVELTPIEPTNSENEGAIRCIVTAETVGQTGVEMEALTGVQIGLLTIYDMCKAVDRGMRIESVQLLEKQGGKSGHFKAQAQR